MPTDRDALILQMSMDLRTVQKSIDRANGIADTGFNRMEKRATLGARNVESALGGIKLPKSLAREFNKLGEDIGTGFKNTSRAAQVALAGISVYAIKLASDAGEIESAFDVAFKGSAQSAREFADVLSSKVGGDAVETREAMTRLQLVLTGTGVAAEQAATMTKKLAEVGIDAGSLFNTSDAEAFQKIISGLSGEAEPLKAFGVVITEAATKAELLRLGFKGNAESASEAAKSIARANLIIKGLAVAQGDATRTAASAANQTRALRAEFNTAARDLGNQLLPAFVKLTHGATDALKAFNDLPGGVQIAGLAFLGLIAAGGPIAGLLANLARVIQLAKETRAAIIAISTANAAAGASGAGAAAATAAGGAGAAGLVAGGAVVGTAVVGVAEIVRGAKYQKTVKAVTEATDEAIAGALESAKAQIRAAASGGPAGKPVVARLSRDAATLAAEQLRRAQVAAAKGAAPAAAGGTTAPSTVAGGFTLTPDQQAGAGPKPKRGAKGPKGPAAPRDLSDEQSAQIAAQLIAADRDALRARLDFTTDLAERGALQKEILEKESAQEAERIKLQIANLEDNKGLDAAKKAELIGQLKIVQAKSAEVTDLQRQQIDRETADGLAQQARETAQTQLDGQIDLLSLQEGQAKTAAERRVIELRLLDLADQRERIELEGIINAKGVSDADKAIAQLKLDQLAASRGARVAGVEQNTQGPMASYLESLPHTLGQVNEAFQNLEANGISSLIDGVAAASVGSAKLGEVVRNTFTQMAMDANRILLQSLLSNATAGAAASSGSGFLKSALGFAKGLFGGPASGLNADLAAGAAAMPFLFAKGTDSAPGGLSIVGEDGPELLNLKSGAQVIPNDILRSLARRSASANATTFAPIINVHAYPGQSAADARRTGRQINAELQGMGANAKKAGF